VGNLWELLRDGIELGVVIDQLSGQISSKHKGGAIGFFTNGAIDRAEYYEHAAVLALIPWIKGKGQT